MTGRYRVLVDENYHHADPESRWTPGTFATADEALAACRKMVDDDLVNLHKPGMHASVLLVQYQMFGDDPFPVAVDGAASVEFSAWDYAKERCAVICGGIASV